MTTPAASQNVSTDAGMTVPVETHGWTERDDAPTRTKSPEVPVPATRQQARQGRRRPRTRRSLGQQTPTPMNNMADILKRMSSLKADNSALRLKLKTEVERKRLLVENSLFRHILRSLCENERVCALMARGNVKLPVCKPRKP